ncbi:MAG: hypothetical protein JXD18_08055 [Anaerolineae bacterium]|nr:hypothetical protein [Anaerolineae bacterium]
MVNAEERVRILKMVQNGQITAEDAASLLKALDQGALAYEQEKKALGLSKGSRQVRIYITDLKTGKQKADLTMAWNLLNVGFKMGAHLSYEGVQLQDIADAIDTGVTGKVLELVDEKESERIEVFVG